MSAETTAARIQACIVACDRYPFIPGEVKAALREVVAHVISTEMRLAALEAAQARSKPGGKDGEGG